MPLSIIWKLSLEEAKTTSFALLLPDHSIKYPKGIIKDILVKVYNFIFPTDFVILDMNGDNMELSFILGKPFLATLFSLIDV